jgi:hypothetical protein
MHGLGRRGHRRNPSVASRIRAFIAACHSGASCSAFGSLVMYIAASLNVSNARPLVSGIGSSKRADQGLRCKACRYLWDRVLRGPGLA